MKEPIAKLPAKLPSNQLELRQRLLEELAGLANGTINPRRAMATSALANVFLKSVNQEIIYALQRGEKPCISFIKLETEPPTMNLMSASNG